jgi:hypothetical protein
MVQELDFMALLQKGAPSDVILIVIGYVVNMVVKHVKQTSKNTELILQGIVEMRDLLKLDITTRALNEAPRSRKSRGSETPPAIAKMMQTSLDKTAVVIGEKT